jgi:DNA-binding XRE family transcriptional regulator
MYPRVVSYRLEMVSKVREWLHQLRRTDRSTARLVGQAITALLDEGPSLGRPLVDRLKGSNLHNLKELRPRLQRHQRGARHLHIRPGTKRRPAGRWRQGWQLDGLVPASDPASGGALRRLPERKDAAMSTTHSYDRDSFLDEFFPEADERSQVEAGAQQLVNQSRAHRLAEMRRRLGLTQAEVAERMHVRQERVSAIERAKVDVSELRTLAAYIHALGGRMEVIADFGGERLVVG